jgi:hypothetical protein
LTFFDSVYLAIYRTDSTFEIYRQSVSTRAPFNPVLNNGNPLQNNVDPVLNSVNPVLNSVNPVLNSVNLTLSSEADTAFRQKQINH